MAIKNWSGWTVLLLWLAWLLPIVLLARANRQPLPVQWTPTATASTDSLSDSQRVVFFYLLKEQALGGGTDSARLSALSGLSADSTSLSRDSLWKALGLPRQLAPEQNDSIGILFLRTLQPVAENVVRSLSFAGLGWSLLLQVVGFLVVPLTALVVITLKWYLPRVLAKARGTNAA